MIKSIQAQVSLEKINEALHKACSTIAPTWPLDQFIAVNPFWAMRHQSISDTSALLSALSQSRCLMPTSYYLSMWQQNIIKEEHLSKAAKLENSIDVNRNLLAVVKAQSQLPHWHNISDLLDSSEDRTHKMAWRDEITHQISQFCAAFFQESSPLNSHYLKDRASLYQQWLWVVQKDRGISIIMDEPGLSDYFSQLPNDHETLISMVLADLEVESDVIEHYAHALLLDINGWAAWVSYYDENLMLELLAIRLSWEWVLWQYHIEKYPNKVRYLKHSWQQEMATLPQIIKQYKDVQKPLWIWQRALELAYQETLVTQFKTSDSSLRLTNQRPHLQAAFCIDVRSESMRSALERQNDLISTHGFAGFFGIPVNYMPLGTDKQSSHLPGLLTADLHAELDSHDQSERDAHNARLFNQHARHQAWSTSSASSFSMVEAGGLSYLFSLLKKSFLPKPKTSLFKRLPSEGNWVIKHGQRPITLDEKVKLASGILTQMGLTENFAPFVLLVGHSAQCNNNPHAAGLECGACGGQSGELNVRILCQLLNETSVRSGLQRQGIEVSDDTLFIPTLHNTTTQELSILENKSCLDESLINDLENAQKEAQISLAKELTLSPLKGSLSEHLSKHASEWSQVRPEWGLANNASLIIAPRTLTRGVDLEGRAFLHDYDYKKDSNGKILRAIMTAPMVVSNWINMQYNASVWDNHKYGSGNKVLHNVVGGNIGVFEGNGGDLRIGLPLQSLSDGENWMHQPMRLTVFIAAPQDNIKSIIETEPVVSDLVNNHWLHLVQLDDDGSAYLYTGEKWQAL
ncbi:DUF2309 domain-containing protein [Bermanella sp. R86510]|uniref:DUF2309 domain-containing protein n=1 Tax=unclassified Bermanella TaxID=2627862 RepID=UPI0037C5D3EF